MQLKNLCKRALVNPDCRGELYSSIIAALRSLAQEDTPSHVLEILEFINSLYPGYIDVIHISAESLRRSGKEREAWQILFQNMNFPNSIGEMTCHTHDRLSCVTLNNKHENKTNSSLIGVNIQPYSCLSKFAKNKTMRDPVYKSLLSTTANALVDRWHMPMLNDAKRNRSFKNAITNALLRHQRRTKEVANVLDIGCGTALLSLYASQSATPCRVWACDSSDLMCELSTECCSAGRGRVTVLNTDSRLLTLEQLEGLHGSLNIVVTETVDAALFGEGILSTLSDAWTRLLSVKNNNLVQVIPGRAEVYLRAVECDFICRYTKLLTPEDSGGPPHPVLSPDHSTPYTTERMEHLPGGYSWLSDWHKAVQVDFNSKNDIEQCLNGKKNSSVNILCNKTGRLDAVLIAFKLFVDEENVLSNMPGSDSCWECGVYPVRSYKHVSTSDMLQILVTINETIELQLKRDNSTASFTVPGSEEEVILNSKTEAYLDPKLIHLPPDSLRAANSESYRQSLTIAAEEMVQRLKTVSGTIAVYDDTPYPLGALTLHKLFPSIEVTVTDDHAVTFLRHHRVRATLLETNNAATYHVAFMWPLNSLGLLRDDFESTLKFCAQYLHPSGMMYPGYVDVMAAGVHSQYLLTQTEVSDHNTHGVKVAHTINMFKGRIDEENELESSDLDDCVVE